MSWQCTLTLHEIAVYTDINTEQKKTNIVVFTLLYDIYDESIVWTKLSLCYPEDENTNDSQAVLLSRVLLQTIDDWPTAGAAW